MKKENLTIAISLLMSVCLLITACGGNEAGGNPASDNTPQAPVWENTTLTKETTAEDLKYCFTTIKETKDKYIKIVITDTSFISLKSLCETLNAGSIQEGREITLDLTGCVKNTTINQNSFNHQSGSIASLLEKKSRVVSILLPETVSTVDHDSFPDFITSVAIPDTVSMIHEEAFNSTYYLEEIKLFEATNGGTKTYTENNGVLYGPVWSSIANSTKSADHAVILPWGYSGTTVTIPEDVTAIAGYTLLRGSPKDSITNPFNITLIEDDSGMCNLESISVEENNQVFSSDEKGLLYNKDKTELISVPRKVVSVSVPASVTKLRITCMDYCAEGITVQFNWNDPSSVDCQDYFLFGVENCTLKVPAGKLASYRAWLTGKRDKVSDDFSKRQWQKLIDALEE